MADNYGLKGINVHCAALAAAFLIFSYGIAFAVDGQESSLSHKSALPPAKDTRVKWGRDPFAQAGKTAAPLDMRLTAIFYNVERPSAIINERIVYRGSEISGQKVIDIGHTHVILQTSVGRIRLDIAGAPELHDAAK